MVAAMVEVAMVVAAMVEVAREAAETAMQKARTREPRAD